MSPSFPSRKGRNSAHRQSEEYFPPQDYLTTACFHPSCIYWPLGVAVTWGEVYAEPVPPRGSEAGEEGDDKQSPSRWQEGSARVAARGCGREPWGLLIQQWFDTHWRILQDPKEAISAAFKDKLFHWGRIFKYILAPQNIPLHFCSWCTWPRTSVCPPWALWHTLAIVLPGASFTAFRFSCHCLLEAPLLPFFGSPLSILPSLPPCSIVSSSLLTLWCIVTVCIPHYDVSSLGTIFFFFFDYHSLLYPQCPEQCPAYSKC